MSLKLNIPGTDIPWLMPGDTEENFEHIMGIPLEQFDKKILDAIQIKEES